MVGIAPDAFGGAAAVTWILTTAGLTLMVAFSLLTAGPSPTARSTIDNATNVPLQIVHGTAMQRRPGMEPDDSGAGRVDGSAIWRTRAAVLLGAVGAWALVGGTLGLAIAVGVVFAGPRALARLESRGTRARRRRLTADAPTVADLLAACLAAGSTLPAALRAVGTAVPGPTGSLLHMATGRLELGADPQSAWEELATEEALAPVARAAIRAHDSGAPLADVLLGVADDLRVRHRTAVEAAARGVGVRAVGPLGACFLPAFMLLGVVPLVGSLVTQVLP